MYFMSFCKMDVLTLRISIIILLSLLRVEGNINIYDTLETSGISSGHQAGSYTTRSFIECNIACTEMGTCRALTYNVTSRRCDLYYWAIQGATCSTGTCLKFGKMAGVCMTSIRDGCVSGAECVDSNSECRDGICKCLAGRHHDPNTCSCVTGCTTYSDTFQAELNRFISSQNLIFTTTATTYDCQLLCLQATFVCRTFEYDYVLGSCRATNVTSLTHASYTHSSTHLYTRDCALV